MNLRTLKKLSKRAAPLLLKLGDDREQFRAVKGENYHGGTVRARKHWVRIRCHPSHQECRERDRVVFTSRAGHRISMRPPPHPLQGTIMVGGMSGYFEPEWDEDAAYPALQRIVSWSFFDYDPASDEVIVTRRLRTPHDVFAAADDLISGKVGESTTFAETP